MFQTNHVTSFQTPSCDYPMFSPEVRAAETDSLVSDFLGVENCERTPFSHQNVSFHSFLRWKIVSAHRGQQLSDRLLGVITPKVRSFC